MAKRHKGQKTVVHDAQRAAHAGPERAQQGLARFEAASYLAARTRPFVVAAGRLRHGWRIVRPLDRAEAAAAQVRRATGGAMRAAASESYARENLRPAISLARAVESGNPRENRAGAETVSGHARAHTGSDPSREGVRDDRREGARRAERSHHASEARHARGNPGAEMHEAVRRAIDSQWALVGASRSALGLTRAVHGALERSWHDALHPEGRRAAQMGAAIGNERERASREGARDIAPVRVERERAASNHDRMHQALARFGNTVGLLAKGLRAGSAAKGGRMPGSRDASTHGREGSATQPLAAAIRIPAAPAFIPVPALAGEPRGRASNPAPAAPIVINSSPTLVVNRADSALDLEQRLLEVLRRHRDALYEQWQREREKRLRTEF